MSSLYHYGILGMRWGKKKNRDSTPPSEDYSKAKALKKKKITSLSNEELRTLNNRLQLERQYKDLTKQDMSLGKKIVKESIENVAKETIKNIIKSSVTATGKALLTMKKKA